MYTRLLLIVTHYILILHLIAISVLLQEKTGLQRA